MATPFDLLPAIDLRGGRVVRLEQGDFDRETPFGDDPAAVATRFVDGGARWLHVVDLDGARAGAPRQLAIIAAIARVAEGRTRVEVAGGLRTAADVDAAFDAGAARAALGTVAVEDPGLVEPLVVRHGAARLAVAVDVREGLAVGRGWRTGAPGVEPAELLRRLAGAGVTLFEVTAIARDGLLGGPDLELLGGLLDLGLGAIVASGGIRDEDDLRAVRHLGCAGAIVGRALHDGTVSLAAALAVAGEA